VTGTTAASPDERRAWFFESGRRSVAAIESALALTSRPLASFSEVLDFGCGPGRVLLWLRELAGAGVALWGTDIDARSIRWAREHVPWAAFAVNEPLPPLSFPDGAFDLVVNHSVFTHLDAHYQDRWLEELHRVTRPGAILLLSVNGPHAFSGFEREWRANGGDPAGARAELELRGIVYLRDDAWLGSAFPDFYHSAFHRPEYVLEHWGRFFEIRGYLPRHALGHQDVVVLERRSGDLPPAEPAAAAAGAPVLAGTRPGDELLTRVERLLSRQSAVAADREVTPSGAGMATPHARLSAVRRFVRHGRMVDRALLEACADLYAILATNVRDTETVRDGVLRQSERISRLELELMARIEALEARDGAAPVTRDPEP
jgi:SAM-dependent methyltransferase